MDDIYIYIYIPRHPTLWLLWRRPWPAGAVAPVAVAPVAVAPVAVAPVAVAPVAAALA